MLTENAERAVAVCGEPGVGKTALIEQLCAGAATGGWQVVRVLGAQAEQSYALAGLNQVVLRLKTSLAGLDERDRTVLTPVLGGDPESSVSVLPLVAAVLNLLSVAAQTKPVLLVADDVHWLDSVSSEVLGAVGRRLADPRVKIVAGRRTSHESVFAHAGWAELLLAPLDAEASAILLERTGVPLAAP
jgi:predicted ATPase